MLVYLEGLPQIHTNLMYYREKKHWGKVTIATITSSPISKVTNGSEPFGADSTA